MNLLNMRQLLFRLTSFALLAYFTFSCVRVSEIGQNSAFLPPMNVQASTETALNTPYFMRGDWPKQDWWTPFNSSSLSSLIEEALRCNPTIEAFQQKVVIAEQMTTKEKVSLFPSISFSGFEEWAYESKNSFDNFLRPNLPRNYNHLLMNFNFNYEFDFWGKYRNQFKSAYSRQLMQIAEKRQVELMVSVAMAQAYFSQQALIVQKRLFEKILGLQKEILSLTTLLYQKAIDSKIPPATETEDLDDIEKHIFNLTAQIAEGKHLINVLRGQGPDASFQIDKKLKPLTCPIPIPQNLSSDLIIRRPDLMAAIWKIQANAYQANAAVADFFPRVNLFAFMGKESVGYRSFLNWQSGQMGLMPSFHIPIFKAGEIRANLKMSKAELEQSIYEYNTLLLKSLKEVGDTLAMTTNWYNQKKSQENILQNASLKVHLADLRFKNGIDNLMQLYIEEIKKTRREIENVQISCNQLISVVNLIRSLGGGFTGNDLDKLKIEGLQ